VNCKLSELSKAVRADTSLNNLKNVHIKHKFVTNVWRGICSGSPHDSELSHLMGPPRVTHAGYMDFQHQLANTATPSFPMDYLEKEKGRQFQKHNKNKSFRQAGIKVKIIHITDLM
jgi:hypothetical protein